MLVCASSVLSSVACLWGSVWSEAQAMSIPRSLRLRRGAGGGDSHYLPEPRPASSAKRLLQGPWQRGLLRGQLVTQVVEVRSALRKGLPGRLPGQRLYFVNTGADWAPSPLLHKGT